MSETPGDAPLVHSLAAGDGHAVLWGLATTDLNVNLVQWAAGEGVDDHVNGERDVLIVVVGGSGTITVDGTAIAVSEEQCLVIPQGTHRSIRSGPDGIRYLSAHRRREPLTLGRARPRSEGGIHPRP